MVRINVELDGNVINGIQITGDFFLMPEDSIYDIENALVGQNIESSIEDTVIDALELKNAILIGITAADIQGLIREAAGK